MPLSHPSGAAAAKRSRGLGVGMKYTAMYTNVGGVGSCALLKAKSFAATPYPSDSGLHGFSDGFARSIRGRRTKRDRLT